MVSATVSALDAAKSEAKVLLSKRDDLEHELEAEMSQLKATGAGEHGSLVDNEVCVLHAAELSTVPRAAAFHCILVVSFLWHATISTAIQDADLSMCRAIREQMPSR